MAVIPVDVNRTIPGWTGYSAGDTLAIQPGVTLTINATPTIQVGAITATAGGGTCVISNASTSTMLKLSFPITASTTGVKALNFESDGFLNITGDFINVYTGTGAATQTVLSNLSSVGGASLDYLTYVEVEESANVWERWIVVPEAVAGFNNSDHSTPYITQGTCSVSSTGAVTITGGVTLFSAVVNNKRFRALGHATDYVIQSGFTGSLQLQNLDGSAYSGGTIAAGATYVIKIGSCFERDDFSTGSMGRVLFYNPLTQAIQCGNGTNGNIIGNGMRVRVPNIYIGGDLASTTTTTTISSTAATAIVLASTAGFPTSNSSYSDLGVTPTILITNGTVTERIGYSSITGSTVNTAGQTRGAHYTAPFAFGAGTKTVKLIPNPSSNAAMNYLDLQSGGRLSADKVMFGPNFAVAYTNSTNGLFLAKAVSLSSVGFYGAVTPPTSGVTGSVTLDKVVFNPDQRSINGNTNINKYGISNTAGACSIKNVVALASYDRCESTGQQITFSVSQNAELTEFNNITVFHLRHNNQIPSAINLNSADGITVSNLRLTGTFSVANSANSVFEKIYVAGSAGAASTFNTNSSVVVNDFCANNIFREILNLESCAPMRGSALIETTNFTDGNIFTNKGFAAYDGKANLANVVYLDVGRNNTFAYFSFINGRDSVAPIGSNAQNRGQRRIRILSDSYDPSPLAASKGPRAINGGEINVQMGPQPYNSGTNFDSQAFVVCTDPATASDGYLCAGGFYPDDQWTGSFSGLSTTAYLAGNGELYLKGAADDVVISSKYPMRGWTSFNSAGAVTTIGTALTNINYEFKLANWGDALPGSWTSLTMANLESARAALSGYSTSVGLNIQLRLTTTATSATRRISMIRMPGTWDTAYSPAVGSFNLNVTGSLSGSLVAVSTDGGTTWPSGYKATSTGSTVTIPIASDFLGTTTNLKVRIRKAGYQVLEYDLTTVDEDVNLPIEQVQVVDIDGVAVYGRGSGTTTAYITIVPGSLRVDIGNILVVGEDLYDACAAYQATSTGIEYPEILQFDGTDSIILNTWKLRRDVAGSTNAMIDMIVKYAPNVNINPVDEVNGSVQLFPRTVRQGSLGAIAATVWDYQTSSATTSGSMGERLKDASTVATNGQQLTAALS